MKKKTMIVSLMISLALVMGSFTSVFAAAGPPNEKTREAIVASGIQCTQKIHNEVNAEDIANTFAKEVKDGGYKTIGTAGVAKLIGNKNVVIIDTMPQGWYDARHIPGAICQVVGAMDSANRFPIKADEKKALIAKVKKAVGTKKVTYYWNGKKWTTKKPNKLKKCTKKKDKHYNKKKYTVKEVDKSKKIVVYCGFVGCARSHEGAKYLVSQGYKNVYRYSGGISAWVDANKNIEGTDLDAE